jgi:hypothetical protein
MLGENSETPILAVPAFPGGEQPIRVLFKSVTEVAASYFKPASCRLSLCCSVTGFFHHKKSLPKNNISYCIIQESHDRKPIVA